MNNGFTMSWLEKKQSQFCSNIVFIRVKHFETISKVRNSILWKVIELLKKQSKSCMIKVHEERENSMLAIRLVKNSHQ